jgi:2-haloacid dehalogenase
LPLPKEVKFVSFDCYGTLIDWETGVYEAFQAEADKDGFTLDRDALIPRFIDVQREIQRGSYELYAEVLRRTAVRVASELGWELEPVRSSFLPNSVPRWPPFRETNAQLERFARKFEIGVLSNIDDKLLGATRRHFRVDFDLVVTAQQVRSYKPDPAHFKECARRIEGRRRHWVHIASGYPTDVEPCLKQKVPVIWVNRHGEELDSKQRKPTEEVRTFRDAGKLLGAA